MKCQSRDVSLKGVGIVGSVKGSLSEKPGVDKYCIWPGVVNAASKRGSVGWSWSLAALFCNRPPNLFSWRLGGEGSCLHCTLKNRAISCRWRLLAKDGQPSFSRQKVTCEVTSLLGTKGMFPIKKRTQALCTIWRSTPLVRSTSM